MIFVSRNSQRGPKTPHDPKRIILPKISTLYRTSERIADDRPLSQRGPKTSHESKRVFLLKIFRETRLIGYAHVTSSERKEWAHVTSSERKEWPTTGHFRRMRNAEPFMHARLSATAVSIFTSLEDGLGSSSTTECHN